tara:strand:- start:1660 stop:1953 length:294 start_codon:yes stop_codon:yes gene_type:complete
MSIFFDRAVDKMCAGKWIKHHGTYESIEWKESANVSKTELQTEADRLQAEWTANQYQRDRQYPSIGDQLDMQYHDELNGTTTWKDAVAKVKSDNPKG